MLDSPVHGLLCGIPRQLRVVHCPPTGTQQDRVMPLDEHRERRAIAIACASDKSSITRPRSHIYLVVR